MNYSYSDLGHAFGSAPSMEDVKHQAIKTLTTTAAAFGLAAVEGWQNKGAGGEVKIGGKVPLNLVVGAAAHAAGFFGLGDAIGIDADYIHAIGSGAFSVFAVNRGHEMGSAWAKPKTASGTGTPRALQAGAQVADPWGGLRTPQPAQF